jgi:hypothetical protein
MPIGQQKAEILSTLHPSGERGIALAAALLALSMLTLIGLSMTFVSSTEVLINQNSRMKMVNLYLAESASEEARERITDIVVANQLSEADGNKVVYIVADSSIDPTTGDVNSNPYRDLGYSPSLSVSIINSNLSAIGFAWVKIWRKTEARAGYSLTNASLTDDLVSYGYDRLQPDAQLAQYVNSTSNQTSHVGFPVYLVTALSRSSAGYCQFIATDIALVPAPPLHAAVFSKDRVQVLGNGVTITGDDQSTSESSDLNGIESAGAITGDLTAVTGAPLPDRPLSPYAYSISSLMKSLKPPLAKEIEQVAPSITKLPDGTYVGSGVSLGEILSEGGSQTTYVDGPLNISDSSGQGILVVNGDLLVTGTFTYDGLIIVKGKIHLSGGIEGINIRGAIISSSLSGTDSSILEGKVTILNNSKVVRTQFQSLHYTRLAFREL